MSLTWKLRYRTHRRDMTMTTPHFAVLHNDRSCLKNMEVITRASCGLSILRDDYLVLCWLLHVEKTTPED